jgi:hypothetical protein
MTLAEKRGEICDLRHTVFWGRHARYSIIQASSVDGEVPNAGAAVYRSCFVTVIGCIAQLTTILEIAIHVTVERSLTFALATTRQRRISVI